jgi:hypothetical protein
MTRLARRSETKIPVTLWRGGQMGRATLHDLSVKGASAEAPFPPGPRETVQISRNRVRIDCQVIWARGKAFGIAFTPPLDNDAWFELTA